MMVATCDKGLPAAMIAIAAMRDLPCVLVSRRCGRLPPTEGEDAGKIQSHRWPVFAHGEISLQDASDLGCKACASPGGGCQFLGTAGTSQVVAEGLGMTLTTLRACAVRSTNLVRYGKAVCPCSGQP